MRKLVVILFFMAILAGCKSGDTDNGKYLYTFEGISMSPTINDQQKVIVDEDYYTSNKIKRDDLVLFHLEENKQHIKRVIGMPNELIQIKDGIIYINNELLESEYDFKNVWGDELSEDGLRLKDDEYFVIGDSSLPMTSYDSRSIGPIAKEDILGKVVEIK